MTSTANQHAIPILTYHQIAEAPPRGAAFRSLYVSPQRFRAQMTWLKRLGWRGVSMRELMPYLRGEVQGRVVGLTFDDGYRNNLESALPVLQEMAFTATCYVVSGQLGGSNIWDHAIGVEPAPLMTAQEVCAWAAAGMEVGSHTRGHPRMTDATHAEVGEQLSGSRKDLEDLLGTPVQQFCYPFGDYRTEQIEQVRAAGYDAATTTSRGRVHGGDDLHTLRRIPVVRSTAWPQFLLKAMSGYEDKYRLAEESSHE
jgi:peptidoglycan/xylan/chitin deacetylase (PgdA/CDA1 family)